MQIEFYPNAQRGQSEHGWLSSNHSFSFGHYYNPERMGFGLLRVINDDVVAPSKGFDEHPHRDMEIISIPLSGELEHKDSEGHQTVIRSGEVQLMSAGTGVTHSEYNHSAEYPVNFLQIWIQPEEKGINPRYDQKQFSDEARKDKFQLIVSPLTGDLPGIKINQQAYLSWVELSPQTQMNYEMHNQANGVYFFLINGETQIQDHSLKAKDALGITGGASIEISAIQPSFLLAIEVPMN